MVKESATREEPGPFGGGEYTFPIAEVLRVLWLQVWVIAIVTIALVGFTTGFSLLQTPSYQASIKIFVGQKQGDSTDQLVSEVQGLSQLTASVAEAVPTRPVAEAVIRELHLQVSSRQFLSNLSAEQLNGTQFIEVTYKDSDPERAQQIANAVGEAFSKQVSELSPGTNEITASVWEQAALPRSPTSPNPLLNALVATVIGLMLGTGLALLLEHLSDPWRSLEDTEQVSGVPTLAAIPRFETIERARGGVG